MGVTKEELDLADEAYEDAYVLSLAAREAWNKSPTMEKWDAHRELSRRADELRDAYLKLSRQHDREESIRRREERDKNEA